MKMRTRLAIFFILLLMTSKQTSDIPRPHRVILLQLSSVIIVHFLIFLHTVYNVGHDVGSTSSQLLYS